MKVVNYINGESYSNESGEEVAIKNKHLLSLLLFLLLIVVAFIGGGISVYKHQDLQYYKNKINNLHNSYLKEDHLLSLSAKNTENSAEDQDYKYIVKLISSKISEGVDSAEFCNELKNTTHQEKCREEFYREKAILTRDPQWCHKIEGATKEYCYYSLYKLTNNKELCQYITTKQYKALCQ